MGGLGGRGVDIPPWHEEIKKQEVLPSCAFSQPSQAKLLGGGYPPREVDSPPSPRSLLPRTSGLVDVLRSSQLQGHASNTARQRAMRTTRCKLGHAHNSLPLHRIGPLHQVRPRRHNSDKAANRPQNVYTKMARLCNFSTLPALPAKSEAARGRRIWVAPRRQGLMPTPSRASVYNVVCE